MKNLLPVCPATLCAARAVALVSAATLACTTSAGGEPSPIQSYYDFVHWMSVNRPDLALQQFTNDAVVVAEPACTPSTPCVGKDMIRTGYLGALRAGRVSLPVYDQRFDGRQLRVRGKQITPGEPLLRRTYVLEFRGGRIASLKSQPDVGDPAAAALFGQLSEKP